MKKPLMISVVLFSMLMAGQAYAEPPPSFSDSMGRFNTFMDNTGVMLRNILADGELSGLVETMWAAFAVFLIVLATSKYVLADLTILDMIYPLLMILITRALLDNYDYLTGLCWDLSEGIAGGIQRAAIGSSDPFLLPGFINDVVSGIEQNEVSWWSAFWTFVAANVIFTVIFLFSVLGYIASAWSLWGYALSKIIGYFFIPFLMLKRTSFLFDGWMRLFTGFLVYGVIARVNLLLTVLAIKSLFGIPGYAVNTNYNVRWDFNGLADIMGLVGFLIVGLLALISTGRFASAVVSGATGFGTSVSTMAYSLARVIKPI